MKTIRFKVVGRQAFLLTEKLHSECRDAFSFSAPGARYTPAHKLWLAQKALKVPEEERQGWDGKTHMMKHGMIPVGLLLGAHADLAKAGFVAEIVEWKDKPEVVIQKGFVEKDPKYDYQNKAVDQMLQCITKYGGGLVLSATGSGKTKTAAQFFSNLKGNCLFIVDEVALLYQSQKEIQDWLSKEGYDTKVGVVGNGKFDPARITIATIQTLHKHRNKPYFKKWTKEIDVILIDEIHKQMSRRNYSVVDLIKPQAVIGLTATLQLKKKPIRYKCYAICGPQIFDFPITKGVEAGVLSQGVVIQVPIERNDEPRQKIKTMEWDPDEGCKIAKWKAVDDYMHEVVNNKNLHRSVVNLVKECIAQDLCVAVLVSRIKHLKRLAKRMVSLDPKLFYGEIKVSDRKKQLKLFDKGKENLILANQVFSKGINVKRIDVVIDAAQRSSRDDCIQKFGRAVRLHAEKAGIYYFDLYTEGKMEKSAKSRKGSFKKHKIPIKVLTTDFIRTAAWSPKELISEADILLTEALKKNKAKSIQGDLFR